MGSFRKKLLRTLNRFVKAREQLASNGKFVVGPASHRMAAVPDLVTKPTPVLSPGFAVAYREAKAGSARACRTLLPLVERQFAQAGRMSSFRKKPLRALDRRWRLASFRNFAF